MVSVSNAHLIFTTTTEDKSVRPPYTDEETEAQRAPRASTQGELASQNKECLPSTYHGDVPVGFRGVQGQPCPKEDDVSSWAGGWKLRNRLSEFERQRNPWGEERGKETGV